MLTTKNAVLQAISASGLPSVYLDIVGGDVPPSLDWLCSPPFDFSYPLFFRHPDAFPEPDELLILWDANGDSLTGLLTQQRRFIEFHFEDGPAAYESVGENYQQFACWIIRSYFNSFDDVATATALSAMIEFRHLADMLDVYAKNTERVDLSTELNTFVTSIA